ncbi:hypothetical protein PoHVEF18_001087 [Penicillium ochrochloron]
MSSDPPEVSRGSVNPQYEKLFREIEAKFKASSIPTEKWYLTALGAILPSSEPYMAGQLYLYLLSEPAYSTPDERKAITIRFKEVILKAVALLGIPKPAEAIASIEQVDGEELPFSREGWQCDEANHQRGVSWLQKMYAQNMPALLDLFKRHRDFGSAVCDIAYGLCLSDRQILDDVDTEIVVLPAVMSQNLPRMTYWHVKGCRRAGISKEDV